MADPTTEGLPKCGLYRTGLALAGQEEQVGAGRLVYFHNHSEQGPPLVLLPRANTNNKWDFGSRGVLVNDSEFIEQLVPLMAEGYYTLSEHLHVSKEEVLPTKTLVQLGYNPKGEPIVFVGRFEHNSIHFPEKGFRFGDRVFDHLEPAGFRSPRPSADRILH